MSEEKITVHVNLQFKGEVEVKVPISVPENQRKRLATLLALAKILATTDNPDAPEDEACDQYANEFGLTNFGLANRVAGQQWDNSEIVGVSGSWEEAE